MSFASGPGTKFLLYSGGVVPSGTANGVLYLNGSKEVTSGSALTFDGTNFGLGAASPTAIYGKTLQIASGASEGSLSIVGSSGAVFLATVGATGQLIARGGSSLVFGANDIEQMRLTTTGLGIGTISPIGRLAVVGSASGAGVFSVDSDATRVDIQSYNKPLAINRQGNDTLFNEGGGNLGIGTTSPGAKLDVVGASSDQIRVGSAATEHYRIGRNASDGFLDFYASQTGYQGYRFGGIDGTWATLNSSGNLGLGVTPSAWGADWRAIELQYSSAGQAFAALYPVISANTYNDGTNYIYKTTAAASYYSQVLGQHRWHISTGVPSAGSPISFTQAMTLDASGRLLVGTTSNLSGEPLQIDGNGVGSTIYTLLIRNTSTSTSVYNMARWGQNASGSAVGYIGTGGSAVGNPAFQNTFVVGTQTSNPLVFNTNDAERARIPAAGGMVVGTAAIATTATDGFLYVPTCAGTPTGTPTTQTGTAPIVVDTTNHKLYFYSGGTWRDAGP